MKTNGRRISILSLSLASLFVLSALASSPSAMAAWSARVTATGSVSAGSLSVAFAGALPTVTFINSALSSTASLSVSNTTSSDGAPGAELELTLSGPADSPLAAATNVVVWPVLSPAECTDLAAPGAGAFAGKWASPVTLTTDELAAGGTQTYCLRSSLESRQSAATSGGAQSFEASATARLVLHAFSASVTSVSHVTSAWIYPASTLSSSWYSFMPSGQAACVDVTDGADAAPGSRIGTYSCLGAGSADQLFTFDPLADSLVGIRSGVSNLLVGVGPDGGPAVQTSDPSDPSQRWEPQLVSPGTFQLVNDATGMCLTAPASFGPLSMAACDGSSDQTFIAVLE
jgi:hypothetical protein